MTIEAYRQGLQEMWSKTKFQLSLSPDFLCRQSKGFPLTLVVSLDAGMAWLQPNSRKFAQLKNDSEERRTVLQACADFGFRDCGNDKKLSAIIEELAGREVPRESPEGRYGRDLILMEEKNVTIEKYEDTIQKIMEMTRPLMVSVSPDFQCDQSAGFPVSLNYSTTAGLAWLEPNSSMLDELGDQQRDEVLQACADFGFRRCESNQDYNAILEGLGEDAVQSAWLPEEDEDQEMGGFQL